MKPIPVLGVIAAALTFATPALADSPSTTVFNGAVSCITRPAGDATAGQRWCEGDGQPQNASVVPSFDGTPIDVTVAFPPAPASGTDGKFPVVGIFSGYGSNKLLATDTNTAQRWLQQGYAVFSISYRGFYASCGAYVPSKPPACDKGYIHLMSNAYEVRDVQYLLGQLADEGVIDPNRIGANGGSYGGGMSMQLATLNNRTQLPDGTLVPWTSPGGLPMHIAAAIPEYAWSDLIASLQPNGSTLDYAAENPYTGPAGDRRFGIQKLFWNQQLYYGALPASQGNPNPPGGPGYYAPTSGTGFPDPAADIQDWKAFNDTGGPYDGQALAAQQMAEFVNHGAANIDSSVAPAPMLITNGWNDDLFPVDEGVRIYNRIRDLHPNAPVSLYDLNYGHPPRAGNPPTGDVGSLYLAEGAWFAKYVKGQSSAPVADPVGGVTVATSACDPGGVPTNGATYHGTSWAAMSQGEVRVDGAAAQTISPGTSPATTYNGSTDTVCTTGPSTDTSGAAIYSTAPAPASGYTILGASTVVADLGVTGPNDQVIGRLLDVNPATNTERLIGRSIYRPTGVGSTTKQVFQLHPQAWKVAAGHVVKLELLSSDAPYARPATGQNPVTVSNLQLRIPTVDAAGAAGGLVQTQAEKVLPAGYTLARDLIPSTGPVTAPSTGGTVSTPVANTPAPVVVPAKDALTDTAARALLGHLPKGAKVTSSRSSITFTDSLPEAGTVNYTLSLDAKKGKKTHRYKLGAAVKTVLAPGPQTIKITISKSRRALLKKHPGSKVVLTTTFTTGVLKHQLGTTRKFTPKH
ncbi:MAG: CocE/NonD family hydrolase [Solirubrobacteraceae bacterium]|nr:CocE/NonD family hydrolase [Patulibacter sp.]